MYDKADDFHLPHWDLSDAEIALDGEIAYGRDDQKPPAPPLRVTVNQPLRETIDPLDLTLWTLLREADALTVGFSIGAFVSSKAQRESLSVIIQQLQRAELLAIETGV